MNAFLCAADNCTGCGACASVCAAGAIELQPDEEGFLHPVTDKERCLSCGACTAVCPVLGEKENHPVLQALAACSLNQELRRDSSSGGVFSLLAQWVLEQGGAVYGAAFAPDQRSVRHIRVEDMVQLALLRGSKYIQSVPGNMFADAAQQLRRGRWVLFSGTPCQTAAFKRFLGQEPEHLLTVDILCHGVAAPAAWRAYLDEEERTAGSQVRAVSLRDKSRGWRRYGSLVQFSNGKSLCRSRSEDPFLRCYAKELMLRESCYHCPFKGERYAGDITLGDLWGIRHFSLPQELDDDEGTSLVLLRSQKGKALWAKVAESAAAEEISAEEALCHNSAALRSVERPAARDKMPALLRQGGIQTVVKRLCPVLAKERLRHLLGR